MEDDSSKEMQECEVQLLVRKWLLCVNGVTSCKWPEHWPEVDSDLATHAALPYTRTGPFVIYPDRRRERLIEGGPVLWLPREPSCPWGRNRPRMRRPAKPQPLPFHVRPRPAPRPDSRKPLQRQTIRIMSAVGLPPCACVIRSAVLSPERSAMNLYKSNRPRFSICPPTFLPDSPFLFRAFFRTFFCLPISRKHRWIIQCRYICVSLVERL